MGVFDYLEYGSAAICMVVEPQNIEKFSKRNFGEKGECTNGVSDETNTLQNQILFFLRTEPILGVWTVISESEIQLNPVSKRGQT